MSTVLVDRLRDCWRRLDPTDQNVGLDVEVLVEASALLATAASEIECLRAERDALAKDAARYRWLRERAVRNTAEGQQVWCVIGEGALDAHPIDLDELDVAVDAAMAGKP